MSFFSRLNTLIRADAHGVVDALEDKALLLKQTLREAELALNRKRARVETLLAEQKTITDARAHTAARIAALDEDVGLALGKGKDELAKFSIRKLLPLRREHSAHGARLAAVVQEHTEVTATLAQQEGDFEALKVRVREHLTRLEAQNEDRDLVTFTVNAVEEEEVELELLRRQQEAGRAVSQKGGA